MYTDRKTCQVLPLGVELANHPVKPRPLYEMAENREEVTQTVFVIRHGERIDHVDPHWAQGVERYYDPPITSVGEQQAREVGRMLKGKGKVSVLLSSC